MIQRQKLIYLPNTWQSLMYLKIVAYISNKLEQSFMRKQHWIGLPTPIGLQSVDQGGMLIEGKPGPDSLSVTQNNMTQNSCAEVVSII